MSTQCQSFTTTESTTPTVPNPASELIPLTEVGKALGIPGLSHPTCWRWVLKGVAGEKLKAVQMGRRWMTRLDWLQDFGERRAAATIAKLDSPPSTLPTTIPAKSKRTEAQLTRDPARAQRDFDRPAR